MGSKQGATRRRRAQCRRADRHGHKRALAYGVLGEQLRAEREQQHAQHDDGEQQDDVEREQRQVEQRTWR